MRVEARLTELGLVLPAPTRPPPGARLPFANVRVRGRRALVAGHGLNPDGSLAGPFGKVPTDVTPEQAYASARLVCLSMLASLKRTLGDLDRVTAWLRVFGMVNSTPDFTNQPNVINGCSDLLLQLYGDEAGQHTRSAVGLVALPFNIPVEIEAEVEIDWPANWSPVCSGSGRAGGRIEWSHFGWRWRECGAGKTCGLPGSGRCARDVTAQETLDSGGSSTLAVAVRLD
jgi:hypothetical protein